MLQTSSQHIWNMRLRSCLGKWEQRTTNEFLLHYPPINMCLLWSLPGCPMWEVIGTQHTMSPGESTDNGLGLLRPQPGPTTGYTGKSGGLIRFYLSLNELCRAFFDKQLWEASVIHSLVPAICGERDLRHTWQLCVCCMWPVIWLVGSERWTCLL